jgi:hypothetical protein
MLEAILAVMIPTPIHCALVGIWPRTEMDQKIVKTNRQVVPTLRVSEETLLSARSQKTCPPKTQMMPYGPIKAHNLTLYNSITFSPIKRIRKWYMMVPTATLNIATTATGIVLSVRIEINREIL